VPQPPVDTPVVNRGYGVVLGIASLVPGVAVGVTFAAAVNLYYTFHPVYFVGTAIALALTWLLGRASLRAFGAGRRLALVLPLAIAAVLTGLFFTGSWLAYPDRAAAARKHRVVLRTVPVYPGLGSHSEETSGRGSGDLAEEGFINPPDELLTTWTWLLPRTASVVDVAAWYEVRLRAAGWEMQRDDVGDGSVEFVGSRRGVPLEVDVAPRRTACCYGASRTAKTFPAVVDATAGP
jgi:hypothetical protein